MKMKKLTLTLIRYSKINSNKKINSKNNKFKNQLNCPLKF